MYTDTQEGVHKSVLWCHPPPQAWVFLVASCPEMIISYFWSIEDSTGFQEGVLIQRASGLCSLQLIDCAINFSKAIQTQTSCFSTDRSLFCLVLPAAKGKHLGSTWLYLGVQLRSPEQNFLWEGNRPLIVLASWSSTYFCECFYPTHPQAIPHFLRLLPDSLLSLLVWVTHLHTWCLEYDPWPGQWQNWWLMCCRSIMSS